MTDNAENGQQAERTISRDVVNDRLAASIAAAQKSAKQATEAANDALTRAKNAASVADEAANAALRAAESAREALAAMKGGSGDLDGVRGDDGSIRFRHPDGEWWRIDGKTAALTRSEDPWARNKEDSGDGGKPNT